jgi:hypothetical protein
MRKQTAERNDVSSEVCLSKQTPLPPASSFGGTSQRDEPTVVVSGFTVGLNLVDRQNHVYVLDATKTKQSA